MSQARVQGTGSMSSTRSQGATRELREWIEKEMEMRGWSKNRLGRELELYKGTVGKWLLPDDSPYQRRPSYESCRRLSELFGVSLEYVLDLAGIDDDYQHRNSSTALQQHIISMIPLIPDRMLVVVRPQINALIDKNIQNLVKEHSMTSGIRTIIYPVRDIDQAKARFTALLGVEPTSDTPYYVGFTVDGQDIGLDPNGHAQGMTGPVAYVQVDDIEASVKALAGAGAEEQRPITDVGGGRRIAVMKDTDGNAIGLAQDQ